MKQYQYITTDAVDLIDAEEQAMSAAADFFDNDYVEVVDSNVTEDPTAGTVFEITVVESWQCGNVVVG